MNQHDIPKTRERFRKDFSIAQVLASALSAVTCMFLAPKIGIIGGVLGVAIGAAVAAIASQIYKILLNATKDKIAYQQQKNQLDADIAQLEVQDDIAAPTQLMERSHFERDYRTQTFENMQAAPQMPQRANNAPYAQGYDDPYVKHVKKPGMLQRYPWVTYLIVISIATLVSVGITTAAILYLTDGVGLGGKPEIIYVKEEPQAPVESQKPVKTPSTDTKEKQPQENVTEPEDKDSSKEATGSVESTNTTKDTASSEKQASTTIPAEYNPPADSKRQ